MSELLQLPLELRDEILRLVLLSRPQAHHSSRLAFGAGDHVMVNSFPPKENVVAKFLNETGSLEFLPAWSALLLTNRQLHYETKDALHRLPEGGLQYDLEVVFREERALCFTWVSVPKVSRHVERLRVRFRTSGVLVPPASTMVWCSDSPLGLQGPRALVWLCYDILERLVTLNMEYGNTVNTSRWAVTLKHLEIDFAMPEEKGLLSASSYTWNDDIIEALNDRDTMQPYCGDSKFKVMHPAWLCAVVQESISECFLDWEQLYHGPERQRTVFERVGTIWTKIDGEREEKTDLSHSLAKMTTRTWIEEDYLLQDFSRAVQLQMWRKRIYAQRQRNGLPVKPNSSLRNCSLSQS
jgi:hypothetical protein